MNLIEKLGLEKCKAIVGGAPSDATTARLFFNSDQFLYGRCHHHLSERVLLIEDLRTAIADHERTDHCTDIRNHISNNTKVIER